jgi:dolichyl-phosphate beta-glucosyltransferase
MWGDFKGGSQLTSITTRQLSLPALAPCIDDSGEEPGIPAVLMRDPCHLEVLIPARDEARRLPGTLTRTIEYLETQPYSSSVVVIDNGSVDHTADLAARAWSERVPVHLTGCAQPGKGAAVRRGILTSQARFLGYMDADLATPIETLDIVVPLLSDFQAVVGSRRIRGAALAKRQPPHRAVSGMVFRAMASRVLPGIADTQCGFKFFAGDLARTVAHQLHIDGFAFDVELLRAITEIGVPVKEIPVVWSDKEGSTLHALRDGARAAADLLRLARRRPV